jgi:hypothetical protein
MQMTGGGASGPVGKRANGSLLRELSLRGRYNESKAREDDVQAAVRDRELNPQTAANALMHKLKREGFAPGGHNENDYTPLDFAKQIYQFPGKVYDSADRSLRGLIDLGANTVRNVAHDQAPFEGIKGDEIVSQTFHDLTDPVGFANRDPFNFMLTAAGGGALAEKALARAAAARGASIPEWLGSEEGAIGRLGERLEAGDVPMQSSASPGMISSRQFSATNPDLSVISYPDEGLKGLGVVKGNRRPFTMEGTDVVFHPMQQGTAEAAASELNAGSGFGLRMPGSQYGNWEWNPRTLAGKGEWFFDGPRRSPGSLTEWVDNLQEVDDLSKFDYSNPMIREQLRKQDIFDQVIGNNDRGGGFNEFATADPEGLNPIAMDFGAGFQRQASVDTAYHPQAWWESREINPTEIEGIKGLIDYLSPRPRLGTALDAVNPGAIRMAIDRARAILERGGVVKY